MPKKKHQQDIIIIVTGRIAQIIVMMAAIYLLTSILPPDELGRYYLFMSLITFPGLVFINPVAQFINRKTNAWNQSGILMQRLYDYNFYVLLASLISSVAFYLLVSLGFFSSLNATEFVLLLFTFVLFNTWSITLPFILNMLFHRLMFTLLTLLASVLVLSLSVYLSHQSHISQDWLTGTITAYAIISVLSLTILLRVVKINHVNLSYPNFSKFQIQNLIKFSLPLLIATLFMWVQASGLRVLVEEFFSLAYLAFLGVGLALARQITMAIEGIVSHFYHPIFYSNIESKNISDREYTLNKILEIIIPIYTLMLVFLASFSQEIFSLLIDEKYQSAYQYFLLGIIFEFFRMLTNLYANAFHSEMKTYKLILPYFIGSLFTLAAIYAGHQYNDIYEYLIPAVWSTGMLATFLTMYIYSKQILVLKFPFHPCFKTLLLSLPLLIYSFIINNHNLNDIFVNAITMLIAGIYCLLILFLTLKGPINGMHYSSNKGRSG